MNKNEIIKESLYIKSIIAVMKGSCMYRFNDDVTFTAQAGDVLYLPRKAAYVMYIDDADYKFIFCDFEFSDQSEQKAICVKKNAEHADGLFAHLLNCYQAGPISARANCMSILYRIYSLLLKNAEQGDQEKNQDARISAAKLYMDEHYNDDSLSIFSIAERSGISEVYFRKLFKEKYCISPSKYLITARLNNAKKLMRYAFLSIEDCALQSGFSSVQYFGRVFKKELGICPREYRKNICTKQ